MILEIFLEVTEKVNYKRADKNMLYPYLVYEARRLSSENGIDKYVLEVNAWDKKETEARIAAMMDQLERHIDGLKKYDKNTALIIHKGPREGIDDEDKSIKRIREQFELVVCEGRRE